MLGLGAPLGWYALSWLFGFTPEHESYDVFLTLYMSAGTICVFAGFGYVIGKKEEKFAEQSLIDGLTSLYNARQFKIVFSKEFARLQRLRAPLSMMMVDIDFFKNVNDTYGHPSGDAVLAAVAHALVREVREADTVARVGGEEFAVLLPGTTTAGAMVLGERMRQAIADLVIPLPVKKSISVKISIGIACTDVVKPASAAGLYASADEALYKAKSEGRNRVAVASAAADVAEEHEGAANCITAEGNNPQTGDLA